jgi:hypothetical protein
MLIINNISVAANEDFEAVIISNRLEAVSEVAVIFKTCIGTPMDRTEQVEVIILGT